MKSIIPAKQFNPHRPLNQPNQEIQIDFGGPIIDGLEYDFLFPTAKYSFSKYPTAEVSDKANGLRIIRFLDTFG